MRIDDQHRTPEHRKDPAQEEQLRTVNELLAPLENSITADTRPSPWPPIFILGLPRSGTTLLAQVLAASGGLGYPTNFVARFWKAPAVGILIEKAMGFGPGAHCPSFRSNHGVTEGWEAPHEFGYFWERWFTFRDTHKVSEENLATVDRAEIVREVNAMIAGYDKPFFFKSLVCDFQLELLKELFPRALYVVNTRQSAYVAQSIYLARTSRLGSVEHWYSLRPPEYTRLKTLSVPDQIAGQIHCSMNEIRRGLSGVPEDRILEVAYTRLCEATHEELARVLNFVESNGYAVSWSAASIPESFPSNDTVRIAMRDFRMLERVCNACGELGREESGQRQG